MRYRRGKDMRYGIVALMYGLYMLWDGLSHFRGREFSSDFVAWWICGCGIIVAIAGMIEIAKSRE